MITGQAVRQGAYEAYQNLFLFSKMTDNFIRNGAFEGYPRFGEVTSQVINFALIFFQEKLMASALAAVAGVTSGGCLLMAVYKYARNDSDAAKDYLKWTSRFSFAAVVNIANFYFVQAYPIAAIFEAAVFVIVNSSPIQGKIIQPFLGEANTFWNQNFIYNHNL